MRYRTALKAAAGVLLATCAISLLPLSTLYLEFAGLMFCGASYWTYIAKFYGSYFLFPIFGVLAAAFLLRPLAVLWLILDHDAFKRVFRYALGGVVALVAIASFLEFSGSPNALFEVSPASLKQGDGKLFFNHFQTACSEQFSYKGKYDGAADSFQSELAKAKAGGLSYSHYVYYLAFPVQAGFLALLLACFFIIIYLRKSFIDQFLSDRKMNFDRNNLFAMFGLALVIGSIWCLYRLSYRIDNDNLFGSGNNPLYADYVVFWLYFSIIVIYIILAGFDLEKLAKTAAQVAGAAAVLGLSLAAPKGVTDYFFGVRASIQNFVAAFVLVVILIGIGLVFNNPPPPPLPIEPEDG